MDFKCTRHIYGEVVFVCTLIGSIFQIILRSNDIKKYKFWVVSTTRNTSGQVEIFFYKNIYKYIIIILIF